MSSLPLNDAPDDPSPGDLPPGDGMITVDIKRSSLIGLLLVNTFLTIITLGFYRFWARTKVRQRLWSAVTLQGDQFIYTGTGKELFIGFLVALVILLPFLFAFTLLNNLLPIKEFLPRLIVQFAFGLVGGLLGVTAQYFARRYLLTRTQWRGIHGGQDKALGQYMAVHLKAFLLTVLTLGLIQPFTDAKTYNFRQSIAWFGTARFAASANAGGLWAIWIFAWLLIVVGYGLVLHAIIPFTEWTTAAQAAQAAGVAPPPNPGLNVPGLILSVLTIVAGLGVTFIYVVRRTVLFVGQTSLDGLRFDLPISLGELIYIPIVGFLLYIVLAGAFIGLVVLGFAVFGKSAVSTFVTIIAMFLFLALQKIVSVAWVQVEVLRVIGANLILRNIGALDDILNRGQPAPTRGEGLADAIGDIGIGA